MATMLHARRQPTHRWHLAALLSGVMLTSCGVLEKEAEVDLEDRCLSWTEGFVPLKKDDVYLSVERFEGSDSEDVPIPRAFGVDICRAASVIDGRGNPRVRSSNNQGHLHK